jgi:hypothetical protein
MATSNPTDGGEDYFVRRARERAEHDAFWNRPEGEIWGDLQPAEEDLPPERRGSPYRWFRSPNVIDLVKIRKARGAS